MSKRKSAPGFKLHKPNPKTLDADDVSSITLTLRKLPGRERGSQQFAEELRALLGFAGDVGRMFHEASLMQDALDVLMDEDHHHDWPEMVSADKLFKGTEKTAMAIWKEISFLLLTAGVVVEIKEECRVHHQDN